MDYKALYEQSQKENEKLKEEHVIAMNGVDILEIDKMDLKEEIEKLKKENQDLRMWGEVIIPNFFTRFHIETLSDKSWSQERFESLKDWVEDNLCSEVSEIMKEGIARFEVQECTCYEEKPDLRDWQMSYGGSGDGKKYILTMAGGSIDAWRYEIHRDTGTINKVYSCPQHELFCLAGKMKHARLIANHVDRTDEVKLVPNNYEEKENEYDFYKMLNDTDGWGESTEERHSPRSPDVFHWGCRV